MSLKLGGAHAIVMGGKISCNAAQQKHSHVGEFSYAKNLLSKVYTNKSVGHKGSNDCWTLLAGLYHFTFNVMQYGSYSGRKQFVGEQKFA